jgi:hypothetical protein
MTNPKSSPTKEDEVNAGQLLRQGDVLLERVDHVPAGLKTVPLENGRRVLAHGEVTGHAHVLEGEAELFAPVDVAELEEMFLRVEAESALVHDEHDTITVPPGDWRVARQVEYSPEAVRQVAD